MLLEQALIDLRDSILPNVSDVAGTAEDNLLRLINLGLITLHTTLDIKKEQAILRASAGRKFFHLVPEDPDVVLGSLEALSTLELSNLNNPNPTDITFDNLRVHNACKEILQVLEIEDLRKTRYVLNEKNVFSIEQDKLYFPNIKEGNLVYVTHKPKPKLHPATDKLDLPDTLIECLYAFVASRVTTGIESYKEFHLASIQDYTIRVQEAIGSGAILQTKLNSPPIQLKGFM